MVTFRPSSYAPQQLSGFGSGRGFSHLSPFMEEFTNHWDQYRSPLSYLNPNERMPIPGFYKGGNVQYTDTSSVPDNPFDMGSYGGREAGRKAGYLNPQTDQLTPFAKGAQDRQRVAMMYKQLSNPVGVKTFHEPRPSERRLRFSA